MTKIAKELPAGFEAYSRSLEFTPETLPARLQSAHMTKAGTWGLLHVLEGKMLYQLESPNTDSQIVSAGEYAVIEAEVLHSVKFVEAGRVFVEFFRKK